MIRTDDWRALSEKGYLHIDIQEELPLEGLEILVLGPSRNTLHKGTVTSHHFDLDLSTLEPTFVELVEGHSRSVRYVEGSGGSWYGMN